MHWDPLRTTIYYYSDTDSHEDFAWEAQVEMCPECAKEIVFFVKGSRKTLAKSAGTALGDYEVNLEEDYDEYLVWPQSGNRSCPPEVQEALRVDFLEASQVLSLSPKASAALSRRCLQHLLVDYAKVAKGDLAKQIEEIITRGDLSSTLSSQLDATRHIGNFAAHPLKSKASGEILPVEPQEAEWNLDLLEDLFDHFFVKPERTRKRKEELNKKLAEAGKPLLI
jgi:hypothetical protein